MANYGALPYLPAGAVVEVPCLVDAGGARPLAIGSRDPHIRGLSQHVKAYEELTVEAAVTKDYLTALLALATHPLTTSVNKARRILERLNDALLLGLAKTYQKRPRGALLTPMAVYASSMRGKR